MKQQFLEDMFMTLTKPTMDRFLKEDNPLELIGVYMFIYYTAKWQGTNQPKCTTGYIATGCKISEAKVRKIKKQLADMGLIEDVQARDESNRITGHFIRVNYILRKSTEMQISTLTENHRVEQPEGGIDHRVESMGSNALSADKENASSPVIPNACSDGIENASKANKPRSARLDIDEIFSRYTKDEKTLALLHDWLDVRKAKRAPKTERALTANLDKLEAVAKASCMSVNAYLEAVIMRGWAAFYEIQQYGSQKQQYRRPYDNPTAHLTAKDHEMDCDVPWHDELL